MTSFENNEKTWQRFDYSILQNSPIALYWNVDIWQRHINWFSQNGYKIILLDAARWTTEKEFHEDVQENLEFPGYYGMNLNAFNDCLSDLEFPDHRGLVIAIKSYELFQRAHLHTAQTILDIFADSSWYHLLYGNRLVVLVQTNQADVTFAPVGARPVMWNPDEWLNSKRGL